MPDNGFYENAETRSTSLTINVLSLLSASIVMTGGAFGSYLTMNSLKTSSKPGLTEEDTAFCVVRTESVYSIFAFNIYTLRMEAADLSETSCTTTHGVHIPENKITGSHCCEDVISQK